MGGAPIRILVADDQSVVRSAITHVLAAESDFEVVGEAGDGREVVQQVQRLSPDVVLMDVTMPGINGIQATEQIAAENPSTKVVGFSIHDAETMGPIMLHAGAATYLEKGMPLETLAVAIRSAAAGARA